MATWPTGPPTLTIWSSCPSRNTSATWGSWVGWWERLYDLLLYYRFPSFYWYFIFLSWCFYISFLLYYIKTQIPDKWKLKSKTVPYHRCFEKYCYETHPILKIRKISQKKINGFSQKNQVVLQLDAQRMLINIKLQSGIVSSRFLQCVLALIPILLKIWLIPRRKTDKGHSFKMCRWQQAGSDN